MDSSSQQQTYSALQRQLANLKLISRLLGHELHSQASTKSITLSREAVMEVQTTLDLFIEEASRGQMSLGSQHGSTTPPTNLVTAPG